jgi:hypothetical protein
LITYSLTIMIIDSHGALIASFKITVPVF